MMIRIDDDRCTGHGRCYTVAPSLFEPDDEGRGVVVGDGQVAEDQVEAARSAEGNCPERAVEIIDA